MKQKLLKLQIPLGAEEVGIGADDLEELDSEEEKVEDLEDDNEKDYTKLHLKPDHHNRSIILQK